MVDCLSSNHTEGPIDRDSIVSDHNSHNKDDKDNTRLLEYYAGQVKDTDETERDSDGKGNHDDDGSYTTDTSRLISENLAAAFRPFEGDDSVHQDLLIGRSPLEDLLGASLAASFQSFEVNEERLLKGKGTEQMEKKKDSLGSPLSSNTPLSARLSETDKQVKSELKGKSASKHRFSMPLLQQRSGILPQLMGENSPSPTLSKGVVKQHYQDGDVALKCESAPQIDKMKTSNSLPEDNEEDFDPLAMDSDKFDFPFELSSDEELDPEQKVSLSCCTIHYQVLCRCVRIHAYFRQCMLCAHPKISLQRPNWTKK